jgi:hypothetical protein
MSSDPVAKEQIIYRVIRILMGAILFLFAFTQLLPAEPLESRLVELSVANWSMAPWLLRIFIAIEMGIGLLLILNIDPKKRVTKIAGFVMVAMVFDLFGGNIDGLIAQDHAFARPFGLPFVYATIVCVLFYIGVSIVQRKGKSLDLKWKWVKYVLFGIMLPLPFILYGIFDYELTDKTAVFSEPFTLSFLSESTRAEMDSSFLEGDHLVAFFSTSCEHCKLAAKKVAITAKKFPDSPRPYVFFQGSEEAVAAFSEETYTTFNHLILEDRQEFFETMHGLTVPYVFFVRDGMIKKRWKGHDLNYFVLANIAAGKVDLSGPVAAD